MIENNLFKQNNNPQKKKSYHSVAWKLKDGGPKNRKHMKPGTFIISSEIVRCFAINCPIRTNSRSTMAKRQSGKSGFCKTFIWVNLTRRRKHIEERLEKLNLFSLARRRLRRDLILAYNLFHGSLDLPPEESFTPPPCSSLRGHHLKLHHRRFRLNRRKAAFSVRIVGPWNKVPAYVVDSPSADVFKSRLDACWNEVFPDVI